MFKKLYEMLWTRIGGRPWTYIIRDSWKKRPIIWFFAVLGAGAVIGHLFWGD